MSEKLTRIRLPGQRDWVGLMDWGDVDAAAMIAQARRSAADHRAMAAALDAAADGDFQIDVVRGSLVQHHVREVQKSARATGSEAK